MGHALGKARGSATYKTKLATFVDLLPGQRCPHYTDYAIDGVGGGKHPQEIVPDGSDVIKLVTSKPYCTHVMFDLCPIALQS